jgi:wyosine [tRNA(Phe)-imidazoG37] synthetase (radical SAM superfamily)
VHAASTRIEDAPLAAGKPGTDSPGFHRRATFGAPRDFLGNRFVYLLISERAHGLSVGVNLNPDKLCDFDCVYCEVDRRARPVEARLNVELMAEELQRTLSLIARDELRDLPPYVALDPELRVLRHVTLSGDGEPTLSPQFKEALQAVVHLRALGVVPFFKLVLLTNGSGLPRPEVQDGLKLLTRQDEVWIKLDGGTQTYLNRVNRGAVSLGYTLHNILTLARQRPVVIQSLFAAIEGQEPPGEEIEQYALRLKELREHGAQISLVQIYSCTRPTLHAECTHLPLKTLSRIAQRVREVSGLAAEVF